MPLPSPVYCVHICTYMTFQCSRVLLIQSQISLIWSRQINENVFACVDMFSLTFWWGQKHLCYDCKTLHSSFFHFYLPSFHPIFISPSLPSSFPLFLSFVFIMFFCLYFQTVLTVYSQASLALNPPASASWVLILKLYSTILASLCCFQS